jgi:PAS domain S-box-containing protein
VTLEQLWWTAAVVALGLALAATLRTIRQQLEAPSDTGKIAVSDIITSIILAVPLFGRALRSVVNEIRTLKQSEADSRTRYKILTDHVAAAVMLHQADGTMLWCSPFTEVLTGYPLSEIYRSKESFLRAGVHDEDRESLERSFAIVATGEPFQCRYRFYHRSGMTLWFETRTVPIFDATLNDYVALSIAIDVTAHVANQIQIEGRNRDLHEFTYMISHDLKAPILTIKGMLGILGDLAEIKADPNAAQPLGYIEKAVSRLEQLVHGVLELARVSAAEQPLVGVDLTPLVDEVRQNYQQQIDEAAATLTIESQLAPVLGTNTYLYQILSNLLGNSLKYRDPQRPLLFSVTSAPGASRRKVQIVISDTGRGIAADKLALVFKPFHRIGEETIDGSGVGLASVKKLVEKIGGTIRVESTVGRGTTFFMELRRAPDIVHPGSRDTVPTV